MRGSPDNMKRAKPSLANQIADISIYKNSKLMMNKKRGGSSLAQYQGREGQITGFPFQYQGMKDMRNNSSDNKSPVRNLHIEETMNIKDMGDRIRDYKID